MKVVDLSYLPVYFLSEVRSQLNQSIDCFPSPLPSTSNKEKFQPNLSFRRKTLLKIGHIVKIGDFCIRDA